MINMDYISNNENEQNFNKKTMATKQIHKN